MSAVSLVSQHYQKDADGLCCRLKYSIDKTGDLSVVVNREDFAKTGWAIPKKEITKKSMIGKGEFGGKHTLMCVANSPPTLTIK